IRNAVGTRNSTSRAAPTTACQLNSTSRPPTTSITPLARTPAPAAGTPLACAYPVNPLALVKWLTPDFTKKAPKPMRPTQVRMVQRFITALLKAGGGGGVRPAAPCNGCSGTRETPAAAPRPTHAATAC